MSKRTRGKDKTPRRDMFVRINVDDSALSVLVDRIRAAKYQVAEDTPYIRGIGMPVTGRANDKLIHYYLTPVGSGPMVRQVQGYSDPGAMMGLDYFDEAMDYFRFGYMNRATRSIVSAIPGMSQVLYGVYRARAMLIEFSRGTAGPLFTVSPMVSGQDWSMGKLPPNLQALYGKFTGAEVGPFQQALLNWHPLAAVGVGVVVTTQFLKWMKDSQEKLDEDKRDRMRESMGDMSEKEYRRWLRRQEFLYRSTRSW